MKYPDVRAGQRVDAPLLSSMLPDVVVKPATTDRASTTTLTIDPDLQFTAEAGTYLVEFELMPAGLIGTSTTDPGGFVTEWSVPSDATGLKSVIGPASGAQPNIDANGITVRVGVHGHGTNVEYALVRSDVGLAVCVREHGTVTLASAGTVGIAWAQRFSSGTGTRLYIGSYMRVRRVA